MRPKKYLNAKWLTICLDERDIEYLDDHRGKITRGDYLIESMYALKGDRSEQLKANTEKIKQQSKEIDELKRQLMFIKSKININIKNKPEQLNLENPDILINYWWDKYGPKIINGFKESKQAYFLSQEYLNLHKASVLNYPNFPFLDRKDLRTYCIWRIENNGSTLKQ